MRHLLYPWSDATGHEHMSGNETKDTILVFIGVYIQI
jgi:hypothetical protein